MLFVCGVESGKCHLQLHQRNDRFRVSPVDQSKSYADVWPVETQSEYSLYCDSSFATKRSDLIRS